MLYLSARTKEVAIKTFAIIGFVTVLGTSFWLAAYSITRLPSIAHTITSVATAYLGWGTPSEDGLVATSTPLIKEDPVEDFGKEVVASSTTNTVVKPPIKQDPIYTFVGASTTTPNTVLTGLPDLSVTISGVGYLASSTILESFIASSTVPVGKLPAVRFTITNQGTNVTGAWRLSASIPAQSAYIFSSPPQTSLAPGESTGEYILYFDQATPGVNKMISITANSDSAFAETTRDNNSASTIITILGS
jgi:hypothetical protein